MRLLMVKSITRSRCNGPLVTQSERVMPNSELVISLHLMLFSVCVACFSVRVFVRHRDSNLLPLCHIEETSGNTNINLIRRKKTNKYPHTIKDKPVQKHAISVFCCRICGCE